MKVVLEERGFLLFLLRKQGSSSRDFKISPSVPAIPQVDGLSGSGKVRLTSPRMWAKNLTLSGQRVRVSGLGEHLLPSVAPSPDPAIVAQIYTF